jgi:hypothetical protein
MCRVLLSSTSGRSFSKRVAENCECITLERGLLVEDLVAVLLAIRNKTLTCGSKDLPDVANEDAYCVKNAPLRYWRACCLDGGAQVLVIDGNRKHLQQVCESVKLLR